MWYENPIFERMEYLIIQIQYLNNQKPMLIVVSAKKLDISFWIPETKKKIFAHKNLHAQIGT